MNRQLLLGAILLTSIGTATAEGFRPWGDIFNEADTDKSGGLTLAECDHYMHADVYPGFSPFFRNHFTDMDADKNGEVTKEEMAQGMKAMQMTDEDVAKSWREGSGFQPKKSP